MLVCGHGRGLAGSSVFGLADRGLGRDIPIKLQHVMACVTFLNGGCRNHPLRNPYSIGNDVTTTCALGSS